MTRTFVTKEWLTKPSAINYQPEVENIIIRVFNHGKNSSEKSYDLPKDEITISDAISQILKIMISLESKNEN